MPRTERPGPRRKPAAHLIGCAEAADLLGVHRSTVIRRVKKGQLKAVLQLPATTGAYLFDPADILAYRQEKQCA